MKQTPNLLDFSVGSCWAISVLPLDTINQPVPCVSLHQHPSREHQHGAPQPSPGLSPSTSSTAQRWPLSAPPLHNAVVVYPITRGNFSPAHQVIPVSAIPTSSCATLPPHASSLPLLSSYNWNSPFSYNFECSDWSLGDDIIHAMEFTFSKLKSKR